jgi:hypothetical protein
VISRAFFLFFPWNHIVIKKKSFSGEVRDIRNFPPFLFVNIFFKKYLVFRVYYRV